ncbi:hypothetical protein EK21DRAFT_106626 [Setomelanomma holmii]|uniref:Uncharacterized protein n=1 Tax=Setomelanomma holmii TaxID=210430 RepID=A0A9P4HM66_9PLEO|nr:hypothetical protein EK21DRAFT_106626 [Setomelanomma holmii]
MAIWVWAWSQRLLTPDNQPGPDHDTATYIKTEAIDEDSGATRRCFMSQSPPATQAEMRSPPSTRVPRYPRRATTRPERYMDSSLVVDDSDPAQLTQRTIAILEHDDAQADPTFQPPSYDPSSPPGPPVSRARNHSGHSRAAGTIVSGLHRQPILQDNGPMSKRKRTSDAVTDPNSDNRGERARVERQNFESVEDALYECPYKGDEDHACSYEIPKPTDPNQVAREDLVDAAKELWNSLQYRYNFKP